MNDRPIRVLFLCTGNSARSIMAEALLRHRGGDAFQVVSAGTQPKGINPLTLRVLSEAGVDSRGLESKHLSLFHGETFDYVITVCDQAAEECPVFPGERERIHWSFPDPAAVTGSDADKLRAFETTLREMRQRIDLFVSAMLRTSRVR